MRIIKPSSELWNALRLWGNSRLVQSTVVIPVVGYVILFNAALNEYFQLLIDPSNVANSSPISYRLYCLYWGFCSMALASLVYLLRCPSDVKAYGSADDFVDKRFPTMTNREMDRMRYEMKKSPLRGGPHDYSLDDQLRKSRDQEVRRAMTDYFGFLDKKNPNSRRAVFLLYLGGVVLLGIPTLHTFYRVMFTFVQNLIGSVST